MPTARKCSAPAVPTRTPTTSGRRFRSTPAPRCRSTWCPTSMCAWCPRRTARSTMPPCKASRRRASPCSVATASICATSARPLPSVPSPSSRWGPANCASSLTPPIPTSRPASTCSRRPAPGRIPPPP